MHVNVLPGQKDISKPDLGFLQKRLDDALARYRSARDRESIARNETTVALNEVNDLQKKISAAIDVLRSEAPGDSDWKVHNLSERIPT